MNKLGLSAVVLGTGMLASAAASGHHGFGNFALNEDIELTGVITRLDFVNPHSWVHFDVANSDGTRSEHRCELRSATTLRRSGWTPDMFPAGMQITIQGSPDRSEPNACYVSTITFGDGSSLDRYGQRIEASAEVTRAARLPSGEPNIAGDWAQEQLVMTDPRGRDGTLVTLSQADDFGVGGVPEGRSEIPGARGTAEAEAPRIASAAAPQNGVVALSEAGRAAMQPLVAMPRAVRACMTGSIISDWSGEPVNRITQSADTITLQYGFLGLERSIHLDTPEHPAALDASRTGHSIGRWENDVLIVDTIGFLPGILRGVTPHSAALHVVERFTLDPATLMLRRDYTAEDPEYFTETYTGTDTLALSVVPYSPEPCEDLTPVAPAR
ncbi:MAG: hypothetical protein RLZZ227_1481 [Pseudomonadota bacterium]|jgi:hypothetical protein